MRKECKQAKQANLARVQGYHQGGCGETYAMMGFKRGLLYCNSDRAVRITPDGKREGSGLEPEGYGLEVETQCASFITSTTVLAEVYDKIVFPHFKFPDMWKMQRDGSLGGRSSAECITGIMTKSRIRNDYMAWRIMFDTYFPNFGISADSYSTSCGMHVNISNACFGKTIPSRELAIRKFYYIVNKHYDIVRRMVYRDSSKTDWCRQMDYSVARTMDLHNMSSSHGNSINGSHYDVGRIELRLPGGQKDFDTFMKTMETVFFLVERSRSITWAECDNIASVFKGCNQAVFARFNRLANIPAEVKNSVHENMKPEEELNIFLN